MDELIYILIKLIAGMFGGGDGVPKGPGYPNPMPPPRQPPQPQRRPMPPGMPQGMPPGRPGAIRRPGSAKPPPPMPARSAPMMRRGKAAIAQPAAPMPIPEQKVRQHLMPLPAPAPAPAAAKVASVDAAALRRWLRPNVLRSQFILSEIFQPPLGMRE